MICVNKNHHYVNEVQTMVQVFFPGEMAGGYQFIQSPPAEYPAGYGVETQVLEENDGTIAITALVIKDGQVVGTGREEMPSSLPSYTTAPVALPPLPLPRLLMLALYKALQQAIPTHTPWGALTGIRPSKMVRQWLDEGYTPTVVTTMLTQRLYCTPEKAQLALEVAQAEMAITNRIYQPGLLTSNPARPVGLYISIPFCPTRCAYCSFNVDHVYKSKDIYRQYTRALVQEIHEKGQAFLPQAQRVSSIYIGGGTPTALPTPLLEEILQAVAQAFPFGPATEYTVEAGRPDTFTLENLTLLKKYGVNRLAVNPQTLNDATLKKIGRHHQAADFTHAMALARQVGFFTINNDLIVGLPGETLAHVTHTLQAVLAHAPENITVHTLAIKRASFINADKGGYQLPSAHQTEEMLNMASQLARAAGYVPYYLYRQKNTLGMFENIGYAKPGHESLYNVGMMAEVQTIIGMGAGAVTKQVVGDKITRQFNVKNPEVYLQRRGL